MSKRLLLAKLTLQHVYYIIIIILNVLVTAIIYLAYPFASTRSIMQKIMTNKMRKEKCLKLWSEVSKEEYQPLQIQSFIYRR